MSAWHPPEPQPDRPHGRPTFGEPMVPPAPQHGQSAAGDVPPASPHLPPAQPGAGTPHVEGGWSGAWQDEAGQWHYPYGTHVEHGLVVPPQPPAPEGSMIVPESELAPVGPPMYAAPTPVVRDPGRNTLAAVIAFVSLLVGLWAILGYLGSISRTLSSVQSGTDKLMVQLGTANEGLAQLDAKTANTTTMAADAKRLRGLLEGIDGDMGTMLGGVESIGTQMQQMDGSLATLDTELATVNDINGDMATQLGSINGGLASQRKKVATMRGDVVATGGVIGTLVPRLRSVNSRLGHVNSAVCYQGMHGIHNNLVAHVFLGPIPNGSATVNATVVPKGAWTC